MKSLAVVGFDPALQTLDLRDKNHTTVRIQPGTDVSQKFLLKLVVARETTPLPLTLTMGRELVPVLKDAAAKAAKDVHMAKVKGPQEFVEKFAAAAGMAPPVAKPVVLASNQNDPLTKALNSTGFSTGKGWAGFAGGPSNKAPPPLGPAPMPSAPAALKQSLGVVPTSGTIGGQLGRVAPGMDLVTLQVASVNKQGALELKDAAGNLLVIQQTRFAPPPQFQLEYSGKQAGPGRQLLTGALAKELSACITLAWGQAEQDEVTGRLVTQYAATLLKVV